MLESLLFLESDVDMACYHMVPAFGFLHDFSPMSVGLELKRRHPHRIINYGGVSPLQGQKALDDLDRQVEEWGIIGLKLYPVDVVDGEVRVQRFSDRDLLYPILERCRKHGVKVVAIHKAMPLGAVAMDPFRNSDVDYAAIDFPDLNFEVVHSGFAFLDEAAFQIARFPNVYVGLEFDRGARGPPSPQARPHPRRVHDDGRGEEAVLVERRLVAASAAGPRGLRRLEMPADMIDGDGYPPLTDEVKADILGLNYARLHGIDVDAGQGGDRRR